MIQRFGQLFLMIMLAVMFIIMGSSPVLIHCNMANTWKLNTLKVLDSQTADRCTIYTPAEETMDCCHCAKSMSNSNETTVANGMNSCMEVIPMVIQPTIICDTHIEIPSPAEMMPLMALLGICIDNWLQQTEQLQPLNLSNDHFIVPPREVLCHHCILLC